MGWIGWKGEACKGFLYANPIFLHRNGLGTTQPPPLAVANALVEEHIADAGAVTRAAETMAKGYLGTFHNRQITPQNELLPPQAFLPGYNPLDC